MHVKLNLIEFQYVLFLVGSIGLQFWDYGGSTVITNSYIRLTSDHQSQQGILWNTLVSDQPSLTK